MTDKERLQRIGVLLTGLARSSDRKETQHRLFKDAQGILRMAARGQKLPSGLVMLDLIGRVGFWLTIRNSAGLAFVYYDPTPAIEKLLEQLEEAANKEIDGMDFEDEEESEEIASDVYYSSVSQPARDFAERLLRLLYYEFENTVETLPDITQKLEDCINQANLMRWAGDFTVEDNGGSMFGEAEPFESDGSKEDTPSFPITEFINKSLRDLNKERKKRWTAEVKSSLNISNSGILRPLALHFERVYPIWEQAKKIYKESQGSSDRKRRERWRETIFATYPELKGYSDLVERLADPPQLPENILSKLEEKGGSPARSDIALEHAARRCGAPPYEYTIRHLKSVLSKQGMSVRKVKLFRSARTSQKEYRKCEP